jgi:hypothetical protein
MKSLRIRVGELLAPGDIVAELAAVTLPIKAVGAPEGSRNAAKPKDPDGSAEHEQDPKIKGDNITFNSHRGTNADYLAARIARDNPEIHERMKAGEFKSVRQAALEAGLVKPTVTLPLEPSRAASAIVRHFSRSQFIQLTELAMAEYDRVDEVS